MFGLVGNSMPFFIAIAFSFAFAAPWSFTIIAPKSFTAFEWPFSCASLPISTSATPPCAASS